MSAKEEDFRIRLGKQIEKKRLSLNLGVREFALIAGVEHHQLINIEKGRVDIRISTLLKIANGFEVQAKDLLTF
jgi:transcriptional regulator with XRE-family HTH domain